MGAGVIARALIPPHASKKVGESAETTYRRTHSKPYEEYRMQPIRVPVVEFTTTDPITAKENLTIDELQRLMDRHGIRHLPVVRDDVAVGIISDRDIRLISGMSVAEKFQMLASDVMTADPVAVKADTPLDEAVELMAAKKVGSVLVNNEDGRLLGIFTATDALNALIAIIRNGGKPAA